MENTNINEDMTNFETKLSDELTEAFKDQNYVEYLIEELVEDASCEEDINSNYWSEMLDRYPYVENEEKLSLLSMKAVELVRSRPDKIKSLMEEHYNAYSFDMLSILYATAVVLYFQKAYFQKAYIKYQAEKNTSSEYEYMEYCSNYPKLETYYVINETTRLYVMLKKEELERGLTP